MSKNNTEYESHNDEIDLLDLFRRMGRTISKWFSAIGKAILVSIVFLIRNFFPLLISLLFGIGLSYIIKWTTKPFHISEITFKSNVVSNSEMISYINRLNKLLHKSLGRIDPEILQKFLADHVNYPRSICCHPSAEMPLSRRFKTVASLIMRPEDGLMLLAEGNPCEKPFLELQL